jgi:hypothetical protein
VYGFDPPGLDGGDEEPVSSVSELAARCLARLAEGGVDGLYVLLGWSMGGATARSRPSWSPATTTRWCVRRASPSSPA